MPSSSARTRSATRRSPRPSRPVAPARGERPLEVVLAAVFGILVAAEDGYLAWLMWTPEVGWDGFLVVPLVLAGLALAAATAVFLGRPRSWALLVVAAVLPLALMLALVVLFALLGGGTALWSAVGLLVGPVGCLVLATRRPVRDWTRAPAAAPPAGGGRTSRSAR